MNLQFILESIGLSEYKEVIEEAGFTTREDFEVMIEEDLIKIGVKVPHARRIVNKIKSIILSKVTTSNVQSTFLYSREEANTQLRSACQNGDKNLLSKALENGAKNFNEGLACAASGGHEDIVEQMLSAGATDIDSAFIVACKSGARNIVKKLLALGAGRRNEGATYARFRGDEYLASIILQHK